MIKREYRIWFAVFIAVNIWATKIVLTKGHLIGDLDGVKLGSVSNLFIALFLVLFSYYFLLVIVFNYITKKNIPKISKIPKDISLRTKKIVSLVIFLLQLLFFIFNQIEGINVAGSLNIKSNSILSIVWVFIPVDFIFYIYFVTFRNEKYLKLNLLLFIISNLSRGWSGFILILLFLEWCNRYRKKSLNYFRIILFGIVIVLAYPYLLNLKWAIRASKSNDIEFSISKELLAGIVEDKSYTDLISDGVEQIVGRLQQTLVLSEVINKKEIFRNGLSNDKYVSYYGEGFIQIAFRRVIGRKNLPNIGSIAPNYLRPDNPYEFEAYNISVGIMSWIIILPYEAIIYLLFIYLLCYLCVFFIRQISFSQDKDDLIWMSFFFLLVVGWISQYITFVYSIVVFILVLKFSLFVSRISFHER